MVVGIYSAHLGTLDVDWRIEAVDAVEVGIIVDFVLYRVALTARMVSWVSLMLAVAILCFRPGSFGLLGL